MKRKSILLLAFTLVFGVIQAQDRYTFNPNDYMTNLPYRTQILINGTEQTSSEIEVGAFVGDQVRGSGRVEKMNTSIDYYRVDLAIYYTNPGEPVTFKIYDHQNQIEYTEYSATIRGEQVAMTTGNDVLTTNKYPLVLAFTSPSTSLDLTIEPWTDNGGYYLIAPPFGNVNPANVTNMIPAADGGDFDLYYFDQSASDGLEWINIKDGNTDLQKGKGYLYAREQGATLTFTGTPITDASYSVDLVYDDNAEFAGWNLIGNPYATAATLDKPFYRLASGGSEVNPTTESTSINAMEGVFVHATAAGTATFTTGSKSSQTVSLNLVRNDRAASFVDRAIVRFDQGGTLPKFMLDPTNTRVYIPQDGEDYAVATCGDDNVMPVSFKAKENGSYTLKVSIDNVEMGYLHLIDNKTGNDIDLLATPSYTFEANSHDYAERFSLVYATTDGLNESFAFFNGSNWIIENGGKALLQVVDVTGRVLRSEQISGNAEIDLGNVAGVYVLRLINGDNVRVQKVIVK